MPPPPGLRLAGPIVISGKYAIDEQTCPSRRSKVRPATACRHPLLASSQRFLDDQDGPIAALTAARQTTIVAARCGPGFRAR